MNFGTLSRMSFGVTLPSSIGKKLKIANKGYAKALLDNEGLCSGLNVWHGRVTNEHVAVDLGYEYCSPKSVLAR